MRRILAWGVWLGVLGGAALATAVAGDGALAPPPLAPSGWAAWASGRTPVEASAAVVRLGALAAIGYLLAATALGLGAVLLRRRWAAAAVARWSPPVVRRLLGAWLAGALVAGPSIASAAGPPPTMVLLPEDEPAPVPEAPAVVSTPTPIPAVTTITLGPGDHLWSVAARTLATAWGRAPGEREVAPYWRLLVELNRRSLPDPADPDLVFPGDVVRLPPVPR